MSDIHSIGMPPENFRHHGTMETHKLILHAGELSMIFERGYIRHISVHHTEIVRMIYFAVRDKDWLTLEPEISDEKTEIKDRYFIIELTCRFRSGKSLFSASVVIEGRNDSSILYSFKGTAQTSFKKNRIGLCVLHPAEGCAGKPCTITHGNDTVLQSSFPVNIMPHQPFSDIKSIQWQVNGHKINLSFKGDIFEMEDQRNWTDASFKTYSTPLSLPFPVILHKGEHVDQTAELRLSGGNSNISIGETELRFHPEPARVHNVPSIGICRTARPAGLTPNELRILRQLGFDHYRAEIYLFRANWKKCAKEAITEAQGMNLPIHFGLFFSDNYMAESNEFIKFFHGKKTKPNALMIFHKNTKATPDELFEGLEPGFRGVFPDIKIGFGTNANFAELNRNRPQTDKFDFLTYSIHPQEHASDNTTLIENLEAQKDTVATARSFAESKEIWVSPINIKRRFNANIENYEKPHRNSEIQPKVDCRMMSLFGACWTVGSLKYLIQSDADGLTFFETVGERGIIQGDFPSQWPDKFPSVKGMIFPVYFVLRFVLGNKGYKVISCKSSEPLIIDSLVLTDGNNLKIILVNFSSEFHEALFSGCSGGFSVIQLNSKTYHFAVSNPSWLEDSDKKTFPGDQPLALEPCSVSFIEGKLSK